MDPDQENELNQKIYDLGILISEQAGMLRNTASSYNTLNDSARSFNTSVTRNSTQQTDTNEVELDIATESKRAKQQLLVASQNREQAYEKIGFGLKSLYTSLLSSTDGIAKYGEAVNSFGQSARDLGKNHGILGFIFGSAIAALGKLTHAVLEVDQGLINLKGSLASIGGMLTTDKLNDLAISTRFTLDNMQKLSKAVDNVGSNIISLGQNITDAQTNLLSLNILDDSVRRQYGTLGITQDRYLHLTSLYAEQIAVAGEQDRFQSMKPEERIKDAQKYIKTQTLLTSLTGKSADGLQKEIDQVELEQQEQLAQLQAKLKIAQLRKSNDPRDKLEADRLERQEHNRSVAIRYVTALYGPQVASQFAKVMRNGFIDGKTKGLATLPNLGPNGVMGFAEIINNDKDIDNNITGYMKTLDRSYIDLYKTVGPAISFDEDIAQYFGNMDVSGAKLLANRAGQDFAKVANQQLADYDAKMNQPPEADPLAARVEQIRSFERESQALFQSVITSVKDLKTPFNYLEIAAGVLFAAASAYALKQAASFMPGKFSKLLSGGMKALKSKKGLLAAGTALSLLPIAATSTGNDEVPKAPDSATDIPDISTDIPTPTYDTTSTSTPQALAQQEQLKKALAQQQQLNKELTQQIQANKTLQAQKEKDTPDKIKTPTQEEVENNKKAITLISSLNSNSKKVQDNIEVIAQYLNSLGNIQSIQLSESTSLQDVKTLTSFENDMLNQLVSFSKVPLDPVGIKNNAQALSGFAIAIDDFKGDRKTIYNAMSIAYTTRTFFNYSIPINDFINFSKLQLSPARVEKNAKSFVIFADAMGKYTGGMKLLDTISTIAGARLGRLFGEKGPIDSFMEFGRKSDKGDFGNTAAKNSLAFLNFSKAMSILSGGGSSKGGGFWNAVGNAAKSGLNLVATAVAAPVIVATEVLGALGDIVKKIIGVESGGRANVGAKTSSAYGLGQLTKSTFEGLTRQKGSPLAGLTWEQYKADPNIQMKAVNYLVSQEVDFLQKNRIPVSATSIYLAHFLGLGGVRNLYRYPNNTPISQAVSSAAMSANRSVFAKANTVGGLKQWSGKKMGDPDNVAMARYGGTFSGPNNGYPMELHGTEIVIPLDQNSILMKLATQSQADTEKLTTNNAQKASNIGQFTKNTAHPGKKKIDKKMISALSNKFDRVISTIEATDSVNKKILKHSAM